MWAILSFESFVLLLCDLSTVTILLVCVDLVLFVNFLSIIFVEIKMEEIFRISGGTQDIKYNNNNSEHVPHLIRAIFRSFPISYFSTDLLVSFSYCSICLFSCGGHNEIR